MYEVYSRKVVGCVELEAFLDWKYNKSEAVNSREALYKSGWPEAWVVQGGLDAPPPPCEIRHELLKLSFAPDSRERKRALH